MDRQSPPGLLIPRPRADAEAFARRLTERAPDRWRPVIAPLIEIVPTGATPDLSVDALLLTSRHGVAALAALTHSRQTPALAVGEATARAATDAGWRATAAAGDSAALAALVTRTYPQGTRLLHVRGRHTTGDLAGQLSAAGFPTTDTVLYDQAPCPLPVAVRNDLRSGAIQGVVLMSPRTARLFAEDAGPTQTRAFCLSPAVAAALPPGTVTACQIARTPDAAALLDLLVGE